MRGDMTCFHEPFGKPWMQGENPLWPRLKPESPRTPGLTFESVWMELKAAVHKGPVFLKDFPHFSEHLWTDSFLSNFNHSFLIRDPAKVLTSILSRWPHFVLKETGFVAQRTLFDRVFNQLENAPPLIDSDDLLNEPHGIVEAYCNAVRINFISDALSWEPGARDEVGWYDNGSWHKVLQNSDGLKPHLREYIDISEAPDWVKTIYEIVLPHYQHLYPHRLKTGKVAKTTNNLV